MRRLAPWLEIKLGFGTRMKPERWWRDRPGW